LQAYEPFRGFGGQRWICPLHIRKEILVGDRPEKILREALQLEPADRAALVEELLSSLDQPDERVDQRWAQEAEKRLRAFRAGELKALPGTDVLGESEGS